MYNISTEAVRKKLGATIKEDNNSTGKHMKAD